MLHLRVLHPNHMTMTAMTHEVVRPIRTALFVYWLMAFGPLVHAQVVPQFEYPATANGRLEMIGGFQGIWYMNQPSKDEYVYKYSGGMATYPWQHHPIAIYRPEVNKTFFVYGGKHPLANSLLHVISYYDHATGKVARPHVLLDKKTTDAHDNPTLCIDQQGFLFVFSSAHGTSRPAYIHKSRKPYEIDEFDCILTTNFSYPQPWHLGQNGFVFLHTRYAGGRVLHVMNSQDGAEWTEPRVLAKIEEGHYQVSHAENGRIATAFNYHPKGKGLNHRTNIYYMESSDAGHTWSNAQGAVLDLPLTHPENAALVAEYGTKGRLCYMRCLRFTPEGRPVILFVTSGGYQSGPQNDPRIFTTAEWTGDQWVIREAMQCDNNYDYADLEIRDDGRWQISGATETGPQAYNTGGEIALWISNDRGASWTLKKQLTMHSKYNHNFPRRPLNSHEDFYLLWADGHARRPSESSLFFTDRAGSAIWKLPTESHTNASMLKPIRFEIGQVQIPDELQAIDVSPFRSGIQHWRNLRSDGRFINPEPNQASYEPVQVSEIVSNILLFQRDNGGWPKDYDMTAVLTDDQRANVLATRSKQDTSFDNGNTHSQVEYLTKAISLYPNPTWQAACERGLDFMLSAQYANGGFPQRFPNPSGYSAHITFNDGAMIGILNVLQDAVEEVDHFQWIDDGRRHRAREAVERGIDCILRCQIRVDNQLTGWCQQHDEHTYEPRPARTFELASICPQDTSEIVRFLMRQSSPSSDIVEAVDAAIQWMKSVQLSGVRVERIPSTQESFIHHDTDFDVVVIQDSEAKPLWARHYEIGTNRPIFAGRDAVKRYALDEVERERRTGTAWYGNWPQKLIEQEYPRWKNHLDQRKSD